MLSSTKANPIEGLRRFRLQKDIEENEQDGETNPEENVNSNSASSNSQDSESCNGVLKVPSNFHSISDSEEESNPTTEAVGNHKMSNSDDSSQDQVKRKAATNNAKRRKISSSSDSDNSDKESEEPPRKVYSRIKTLQSFQFKKKKKYNPDNSESESQSYDDPAKEEAASRRKYEVPKKKSKKRRKSSETEEENEFKDEVVYDSEEEDSDYEVSNDMTLSQTKVFSFLNSASSVELLQIQSCTQNRVNALLDCRPFSGWKDLVTKLKNGKNLGTQILNFTLDSLRMKDTISKLMQKCLNIAIKTEKCIEKGYAAGIKEQPKILSPELKLKSYQMVGLNWLVVMHDQNLSGILADEMGLGKTIQVIAFLAYLKETGKTHGPHLVVAPSTTLENWVNEFTKWCPDIRVVMYQGNPDERRALRVRWFKQKFKEMDVIITSYAIVSSNYEEKKMFKIVPMQYVIFDEAHMLKNMNTQRYFNLFSINAEHRVLLTGTPLQNNLLELMSLLNFVTPHMFSEKITYIKSYFSKNGKVPVENLPAFEQDQVELAKRIMKPFVLRRLKDDVLKDLPQKTSSVLFCDLLPEQKENYDHLVTQIKEMALSGQGDHNYMSSFMNLRRLANHPLASRHIYNNEKLKEIAKRLAGDYLYKENNENYVLEDLSFMSDYDIHQLTKNFKCISKFSLDDESFVQSGKFKKLDELLPKLKEEGHRVIIFSQFVFMLDLLEEYLRIRDHTSLRLDGSTKRLERQDLIDNYNEDTSIFVFLLSTRAGGMGINLATADTVIIHDVDFNPYNDKQAEDRCHRLGQTKPVRIMRLICKGTVEEDIYAKAQSKLNLEQEVTGMNDVEESEEKKNVEVLLKELLGLQK